MFPRFVSIPSHKSAKLVDFCLSELFLYKPFCYIEQDIGHNDDTIIQNWETFNYIPWHVQCTMVTNNEENPSDSGSKDNNNVQRNTTEHECEIISRLHHGQNIECSEIDMLGRRVHCCSNQFYR